jgi:hypothetical protein
MTVQERILYGQQSLNLARMDFVQSLFNSRKAKRIFMKLDFFELD